MNLVKYIIDDKNFPLAIDPFFITDLQDENEKKVRAEYIVDLFIAKDLKGLKVLDFGCGEGYISAEMSKRGASVVAYDIVPPLEFNGVKIAENQNDVMDSGPYNLVLAYDVFDHMESPMKGMSFCSNVIDKNGELMIRMHPWCSRHGGHLFQAINKAFIHMIGTDDELNELGVENPSIYKVIHPVHCYAQWLRVTKMELIYSKVHKKEVEPVFQSEPIRSRILRHYRNSPVDKTVRDGKNFPSYSLEETFCDYTLVKK